MQLLVELVARGRTVAVVPALGRLESDSRITVRPIAEVDLARAVFVATRVSDASRPSTAAVVQALREESAPVAQA